uniref:Uncharacterized protein n=1 Tax=Lactuca sativa TaxID=4236 RepID=A0A9R1WSF2_LACSA|nr:hypothetical protein LSAT_V11C100001880 [Lactuca sativa]
MKKNAKIHIFGVWSRIVGSINMMHDKVVIPYSCIRKKIGDGRSTRFWSDVSIGNMALNFRFNRLFRDSSIAERWSNGWLWSWSRQICGCVLQQQLDDLINLIGNFQPTNEKDYWRWDVDGVIRFLVHDTRKFIDKVSLPGGLSITDGFYRNNPKCACNPSLDLCFHY